MSFPIEHITLSPVNELRQPTEEGDILSLPIAGDELHRRLAVYVNGDSDSERSLVFGLPWSEFVNRPDAQTRYDVIAESRQERIVVPDNPGVSPLLLKLTSEERPLDVFDVGAQLQLDAMNGVHGNLVTSERSYVGYSMGAITVAKLIEHNPDDHATVERVILSEPVGIRKTSLGAFGLQILQGNKAWEAYKGENPDWQQSRMPKGMAPIRQFWHTNLRHLEAMAAAPLLDSLAKSIEHERITRDTEFVIARGSDSKVSQVEDVKAVVELLQYYGIPSIRAVEFENEQHGLIDSLPRYVETVEELLR